MIFLPDARQHMAYAIGAKVNLETEKRLGPATSESTSAQNPA